MLNSDLTTGDGRWLTYAEAGRLLGISADAARQMARRRRWPRRTPNEPGAFAQVLMPVDPLPVRHRPASTGGLSGINHHQPADRNRPADQEFDRPDDRRTLADAVAALREQLGTANRRADDDRARADRAEQKAAKLQAELIDLLISERVAIDRAERATAEAAELRRRLDMAELGHRTEIVDLRRLLEAADEERRRLTGQQEIERKYTDTERGRADRERDRADQAERRLADKDATITGLVAEQQAMRQQVETLTDLLKARRSWWPWRRGT